MAVRGKPKKLNAEQLWDYALAAAGRRAQSVAEIRRKVASRAEKASDVSAVMAKLAEYEIANDRKFSESFASSRLQNQGLGQARVLRDLRAKQVPERVATAAVTKTYGETNEPQLIEAYLRRKYRNTDLQQFLNEPKNFAAAYRRLRMAGFGSSNSLNALKRYSKAAEDWGEPEEEAEE